MKKYILLLLLSISINGVFGQSKKKQIELLQSEKDSLELVVSSLKNDMEELRISLDNESRRGEVQEKVVKRLKEENSTIRRIMKGYIQTIDELNTRWVESQMEDESTNPSEPRVAPGTNHERSIPDDPFSGGGLFGQGGGSGNGQGSGDGSWEVERAHDGRVRLNDLQVGDLEINVTAKITFKLTIDQRGSVVQCNVIKSRTTTSDMTLINKLSKKIMEQIRYSKSDGAPKAYQEYTIKVVPN